MPGAGGLHDRPRRPGGSLVGAVAVLLILGGGTAVGTGVLNQDAGPPAPASPPRSAAATSLRPDPAPTAAAAATPSPAPVALPASVTIPAIGVQSVLTTVGLTPEGGLAVPQPGPDYDKAAWYDGSPRPGEVGPAVIEGHVDSAENGPSVFYELGSLVTGDLVEVTRTDGSVVTFVVDDVRVVPKDSFPTLEVYGNTEGPELRLITCGGPFDSVAGRYFDNTVVFASALAGPP